MLSDWQECHSRMTREHFFRPNPCNRKQIGSRNFQKSGWAWNSLTWKCVSGGMEKQPWSCELSHHNNNKMNSPRSVFHPGWFRYEQHLSRRLAAVNPMPPVWNQSPTAENIFCRVAGSFIILKVFRSILFQLIFPVGSNRIICKSRKIASVPPVCACSST